MNKRKFFTLIMAALMWTCVMMDIFTSIVSICKEQYGVASMAIGVGIMCAVCGIHYTKEFFKEDQR